MISARRPVPPQPPPPQPPTVADARTVAQLAFDWIGSVAREVDGGLGWLEAGDPFDDLYSGTAGVLLAAAEASAVGLDTGAVGGGARGRLLHLVTGDGQSLPDDGLFSGWAGVAASLQAWSDAASDTGTDAGSDASGDVGAQAAATLVRARIAERVLASASVSARCTDIISGSAGILLALLDAPGRLGHLEAEAAEALADDLVARAEPALGGCHWRMERGYPQIMPGFSHGTAGVAYALSRAGIVLRRPDLVEVAVQGAEALLAAGSTPDGWALPLTIPRQAHRPEVSYGWCHGPTGTVRLFLLLDELSPHGRWSHAADLCLTAIRDSRLPERRYPGYWDNLGRCCGTAGVGQLLVDRYQATGDQALLEWADRLAADVISRAITTPSGLTWSNTEHTRLPPELPPEPGFMQGAAGIAAWLVRLAAAHDRPDAMSMPARVTPTWI